MAIELTQIIEKLNQHNVPFELDALMLLNQKDINIMYSLLCNPQFLKLPNLPHRIFNKLMIRDLVTFQEIDRKLDEILNNELGAVKLNFYDGT
jgi:hypothetical protein